MRTRFAALSLAVATAWPALADETADLSARIARDGLTATRARLAAVADPGPAERFALGGVTFLGAIEAALQERWRVQLSTELDMIPILRLPVPPNPQAEPVQPGDLAAILARVEADMAQAHQVLAAIPRGEDFGVEIRLADLWFDIDRDGTRGDGEGLLDVAVHMFSGTGFRREEAKGIAIRFDLADSQWLAAYTQLIRGVSLSVLAYDPTPAIAEMMDGKIALHTLNTGSPPTNAVDQMVGHFVDSAATVLMALRREPDRAAAAAALAAFEEMIARNREFWQLVAKETDNAAEWIPNDNQQSALGLTFPPGTREAWEEVLAEGEALLQGRALLPYWRLGEDLGLNLRKLFLEPRPVDLVGWFVGTAAVPYAERGQRVSPESLLAFDRMMMGRGLMFALLLN